MSTGSLGVICAGGKQGKKSAMIQSAAGKMATCMMCLESSLFLFIKRSRRIQVAVAEGLRRICPEPGFPSFIEALKGRDIIAQGVEAKLQALGHRSGVMESPEGA